MGKYLPKDVVLAKFPYYNPEKVPCKACGETIVSLDKLRPVLIVSALPENLYWALMITSNTKSLNLFSNGAYLINKGELNSDLPEESLLRTNILMTISENAIIKKYTEAKIEFFERVIEMVDNYKWVKG